MCSLRSGLGTFSGKKVPAIARHEGRRGYAEKTFGIEFPFDKNQNSGYFI
jgi:hypothetical protein